jgi:hypothetical protein
MKYEQQLIFMESQSAMQMRHSTTLYVKQFDCVHGQLATLLDYA